MKKPDTLFEIRCFIDGKRKLTDKLTKHQAFVFLVAANHLAKHLRKNYKVKLSPTP